MYKADNKEVIISKIDAYKSNVMEVERKAYAFLEENINVVGKIARSAVSDVTYAETFFTEAELRKLIARHMTQAEKQGYIVLPKGREGNAVVKTASNKIIKTLLGDGQLCPSFVYKGQKVFTAPDLVKAEKDMEFILQRYVEDDGKEISHEAGDRAKDAYREYRGLAGLKTNEGLEKALAGTMSSSKLLKIVEGAPGCGKSSVPIAYAAQKFFEEKPVNIICTAPTDKAAAGLKDEMDDFLQMVSANTGKKYNIMTMGLDETITAMEEGNLPKDAFIAMDEAGMLGTLTMEKFLSAAWSRDYDSMLIGDASQIAPLTAGHGFRHLVDIARKKGLEISHLTQNLRQNDMGEKQAAFNLRDGDPVKALSFYNDKVYEDNQKALSFDEGRENVIAKTTSEYVKHIQNEDDDVVMVTVQDQDAAMANDMIRDELKASGQLAETKKFYFKVQDMYLSKEYAVGDKVMIKKGIKSSNGENDLPAGTLADVKSFGEGNKIQLALKDDKVITLNMSKHDVLDYAYAMSIRTSQGISKKAAFVAITDKVDRAEALVAFTRHKDKISVNVDKNVYANHEEFGKGIYDKPSKVMVADVSDNHDISPASKYSYATQIRNKMAIEIANYKKGH